jgi:glycosyltransferase involved in cell wall biosynthesis
VHDLTINFEADFNNPSGLGRHARCFGAALTNRARVRPLPLRRPEPVVHDDAPPLRPALWDTAGVGICVATPDLLRTVPGVVQIFSTVWDTTRLPPYYVEHIKQADQVWVPTAWGRDLFVGSGMDGNRIRVVPEGVDASRFRPAAKRTARPCFRFLCVGKWEERKGSADLVRTFIHEFHPDEPVELVMHAHHPFDPVRDVRQLVDEEMRAQGRTSARIVVSEPIDFAGLVRLMQESDAFVLPTRAEGWGLPILEAMAVGLPCIVTDYGGHRTFANEQNSYLIKVEALEWAYDPVSFPTRFAFGRWARPELSHLARLMRHVVEHPEEARAKGALARQDALEKWSWDHAARIAIGHIGELLAERGLSRGAPP